MAEDVVQFPIVLCKRDTLVVVRRDFFDGIGHIDESMGRLDMNVGRSGVAALNWILDRQGLLHRLTSQGLLKAGPLEVLGLRRRRERFRIEPPIGITAHDLRGLIAGLADVSADIPNVSDLNRMLTKLPPDQVLNAELLQAYFGE